MCCCTLLRSAVCEGGRHSGLEWCCGVAGFRRRHVCLFCCGGSGMLVLCEKLLYGELCVHRCVRFCVGFVRVDLVG